MEWARLAAGRALHAGIKLSPSGSRLVLPSAHNIERPRAIGGRAVGGRSVHLFIQSRGPGWKFWFDLLDFNKHPRNIFLSRRRGHKPRLIFATAREDRAGDAGEVVETGLSRLERARTCHAAWETHYFLDEQSEGACFSSRCSPSREYGPQINPRQLPIL